MREIDLAEAENDLFDLEQEVEESGAEFLITRHGRAAAKLSPVVLRGLGADEQPANADDRK